MTAVLLLGRGELCGLRREGGNTKQGRGVGIARWWELEIGEEGVEGDE